MTSLLRTPKPTKRPVEVTITRFNACNSLCAYGTLIEYLNRTSAIQGVSTLLLSYTKPFKPISYFLKIVLAAFSIDTNVFKAHIFRVLRRGKRHHREFLLTSFWILPIGRMQVFFAGSIVKTCYIDSSQSFSSVILQNG